MQLLKTKSSHYNCKNINLNLTQLNFNAMKTLSLLIVFAVIISVSCKKNDETTTPQTDSFNSTDNVNAATDNSIANLMFEDVYKQVDYSSTKMKDSCGGKKSINDIYTCATITLGAGEFNLTTWPKHVTVDFGTGCTDQYGRTRKGKVIYTCTNWMHEAGSVCTVTVDNYYVDGYKIEGSKTITNQGIVNQHLTYHVVVSNGVITHPTGEHHTWASDRTTAWISGESTLLNPWDDKFSTTGSSNGVTTTGSSYTINIDSSNPLITEWTCKWIEQGRLTITVGTQPSVTVDYGNTGCDANATFTYLGYSYNFQMP